METSDVLIVGGGPAGSSCAWALSQMGMNVLVLDKAAFPRDKVCAGWITPAVFAELKIDHSEYGKGRSCQPITAFRTGRIGGPEKTVDYGRPVSYGIRRREFDQYLLERCGARTCLGEAARSFQRAGKNWIVNDCFAAPILVAAGGHFCPVARRFADTSDRRNPLVVAQEIEFPLDAQQRAACLVEPNIPEIYFCDDLAGYGWCFRKGDFLNVGLGREDCSRLHQHVTRFRDWLEQLGRIPPNVPTKFRGHAYYLHGHSLRRLSNDGLLVVGDAAGLAYAQSGEGIRPAIESGLIAARVIVAAGGDYSGDRLKRYDEQIIARFGQRGSAGYGQRLIPTAIRRLLGAKMLSNRWFIRRVVLDRWFLHTHQPPLDENGRIPSAR
jgi:geranylgeranyl reductase family protein